MSWFDLGGGYSQGNLDGRGRLNLLNAKLDSPEALGQLVNQLLLDQLLIVQVLLDGAARKRSHGVPMNTDEKHDGADQACASKINGVLISRGYREIMVAYTWGEL